LVGGLRQSRPVQVEGVIAGMTRDVIGRSRGFDDPEANLGPDSRLPAKAGVPVLGRHRLDRLPAVPFAFTAVVVLQGDTVLSTETAPVQRGGHVLAPNETRTIVRGVN